MKKNDLVYADFFHRCLEKRNRKRNSFMIMSSTNNYYVACCKDFIEISLKYRTFDSIKYKLILEWFYSSGLDWDEDYLSSCVNTIFDNKKLIASLFVVKELFWMTSVVNYMQLQQICFFIFR